MQACFSILCSEMSNAKTGWMRGGGKLAILALGGNKPILGGGGGLGCGWPARYRRRFMSSSILAESRRGVNAESGAAIHWFGRGRSRTARSAVFAAYVFASWPCVSSIARLYLPKEWTDDPDRLEAHICACRCRLCDQTKRLATQNDRTPR